jgi:hypothetical protein
MKKVKNFWGNKKVVRKITSIGDSKRTRRKNKSSTRKRTRGQGSGRK